MKKLGSWQKSILDDLMTYDIVYPFQFKGKARQYELKYMRSFDNLCEYLKKDGYTITVHPGPKGGLSRPGFSINKIGVLS